MNNDEAKQILAVLEAKPADDESFWKAVRETKRVLAIDDGAVAAMFKIGRPTASRWANGAVLPHPSTRPLIYRRLADKVRALIEAKV